MSSSRPTWFPRWLSSVRAVMILLISLATIFPLGIILYQGLQHRSQAYRDSRILTERVATEIVSDQQLLLSSAEQLFSTFSYIPAIRRRDAVAVNALLADLVRKNPQVTNLLVADEKGNMWASGLPMTVPFNASDRQHFRNALETGRFSSSEFSIGRVLNKPTLLFGYPLRDGSGRITDVATVSFTLDKYERYFQTKGLATDVSLSLFDRKGTNVFYDAKGKYQLSKVARGYIAGILEHARGFVAVTNPLVNSFKRLVPGHEAPINVAWSEKNRSPLVRVPGRRGTGTRCEVRVPDPSCNPYLALSVMLACGLDGVQRGLDCGEPVNRNIFEMSEREKRRLKIKELPANLNEALDNLERDKVVQDALGEHIYSNFLRNKREEWHRYICTVHEWEREQYLEEY